MNEIHEDGAPFFFATREPPSATAIDDDIYLTVTTAAVPTFPGKVESIDIILSLDYARHVIAQLSGAVATAMKNEAH